MLSVFLAKVQRVLEIHVYLMSFILGGGEGGGGEVHIFDKEIIHFERILIFLYICTQTP
jgi:hypothetical protein